MSSFFQLFSHWLKPAVCRLLKLSKVCLKDVKVMHLELHTHQRRLLTLTKVIQKM